MFEKSSSLSALHSAPVGGFRLDDRGTARRAAAPASGDRPDARSPRRAGDALRAVEWSEITARLNAARDLRLLLRNESQAPIEAVAASFGDAAASYFALLDDDERGVNLDALGQSKVLDDMKGDSDANRHGRAAEELSAAVRGDAREMQ